MIVVNNYLTEGVSFSDAMDKALQEAHNQNDFVLVQEGEYKIDRPIKMTSTLYPNCRGIIGVDRKKVKIWTDRPQVKDWDPETNLTDARNDALILVERLNDKVISALTLQYKGEFYRPGVTYFGAVNGIYLEHTNHCKVSNVEVSGCNRAGVFLNTTDVGIVNYAKAGTMANKHYYEGLHPKDMGLPKGNVVTNCILHHNRVAGVLACWQLDFLAKGNHCYRNGHEKDGGTGYGITMSSGTVNSNYLIEKNLAEYNYRKGLDVHDGWDGVITDNQVYCNRFHGIAVEHRGYPGKNCIITKNDIDFDPEFRLERDDNVPEGRELNLKQDYYQQRAIRIELMPQEFQKWGNQVRDPRYVVEGNKVRGLSHDGRGEHRVIELINKNKSPDVLPNWFIRDNDIKCGKVDYILFMDSPNTVPNGLGNVTIERNRFIAENVVVVPITIQESAKLKFGEDRAIKFENNVLEVTQFNAGAKAVHYHGTAKTYSVRNNTFDLVPNLNRPVFRFICNIPDKKEELVWACEDNIFLLALANMHVFKGAQWWAAENSRVSLKNNIHYLKLKVALPDATAESPKEIQAAAAAAARAQA